MSERGQDRRAGIGRRETDKQPIDLETLEKVVEALELRVDSALRRAKLETRILYFFMFLVVVGYGAWLWKESKERQDGQCRVFEADHRTDVQELERTYAFFRILKPEDRKGGLYTFALATLPATEAKAVRDDAPGFCDEDGVGLPEPDPTLPPRPHLPDLEKLPPRPQATEAD